ncbi:hypothetical protein [Vibrio parahaemolyticus]|uniref:hypothetical protein n=1 Tax=Vibrio parahaemolyticus TaxID=670 RepID=UPI00214B275A|nr:hypothetical protein [Vibrio parahaemolyticus]
MYRYDYASDTVETSMPIPKSLAKDFLSLANQHALRMVMYTESGMAYLQQKSDALHDPATTLGDELSD